MLAKLFNQASPSTSLYDRTLFWSVVGLAILGFIMVASASIAISENNPFMYAKKEFVHYILAICLGLLVLNIPASRWQQHSFSLLIITIIMLFVVLIVGSSVKGAARWLPLGVMNFQPAELTKLAFFCYLASYLSRKVEEVQRSFWGFCKPMGVMLVLSVLLLKQPDLGTVIVIFTVTLGILFVAGAKLWQFIAIISSGVTAFVLLIIFEPYRLKRVTAFMNPWEDQYNTGYQLTNSLMAIGNGGLWGQGLGNSLRKLGYLPEAHTDFIFAIIAEELGYVGCVLILCIVFFIALKAMKIGLKALQLKCQFSGYFACQIGIWFGFQSLVNVGVTSGLLPTKGLTLPLVSYGGSSLIIMCTAVAILLRIDFENRRLQIQARVRSKK